MPASITRPRPVPKPVNDGNEIFRGEKAAGGAASMVDDIMATSLRKSLVLMQPAKGAGGASRNSSQAR
jgi:hypothetical protein